MALLMAEEIHKRGIADRIAVKKIIYGSERSSRSMRRKISELFGGAELFDITGLTELYGPGTGIECCEHDCIHYWGDYYLLEILDPETLQPVPDGEWGEMVITTLCKEGVPLIRYRTRDITRIIAEPCICGRTHRRLARMSGRSDDMLIIRGVNVFPSQVETALLSVKGTLPHYQIILTRQKGLDQMEVQVEVTGALFADTVGKMEALRKKLEQSIGSITGIRAKVSLVEPQTIQRSMGKAKRVLDLRNQS